MAIGSLIAPLVLVAATPACSHGGQPAEAPVAHTMQGLQVATTPPPMTTASLPETAPPPEAAPLPLVSMKSESMASPVPDAVQYRQRAKSSEMATHSLAEWSDRYAGSARELRDWAMTNGPGAKRFFAWIDDHPYQGRALTDWALGNSYGTLDAFLMDRPGWDDLRALMDKDPDAVREFVTWCRHNSAATLELISHRGGLEWIGQNLDSLPGSGSLRSAPETAAAKSLPR